MTRRGDPSMEEQLQRRKNWLLDAAVDGKTYLEYGRRPLGKGAKKKCYILEVDTRSLSINLGQST